MIPKKLIVIAAPSGAGKTSIVKKLLKLDYLNLDFSISLTTRRKRKNETDGIDYYFTSTDDFKQKINNSELIEWEEVYKGVFYGTLNSEINRINENNRNIIFDIDVEGGVNIKKRFKDNCVSIFIKPPSLDELSLRLKKRNTDSDESLKLRIEKSSKELVFEKKYDFTVINDDLERATKDVEKIITNFIKN